MADSAYRDERETLRARIVELETELAETKTANARAYAYPTTYPPGPAKKCRACGVAQVVLERWSHDNTPKNYAPALRPPRACTPSARIRLGWFSRCESYGEHLHEECTNCGAEWLSAFAG